MVAEYAHWAVLLRPKQTTLGALMLICKEDAASFAAISAGAFAELPRAITDIENSLRAVLAYDRLNYLMLMMIDPHVHFHVLPRYDGPRNFAGATFTDPAWPGPPDLGFANEPDAGQRAALRKALRDQWPATMNITPKLRILWLYVLRQVGAPFGLAATILLLALALERMLRLIDMVAADGAPIGKAFVLLAYLMPHYLQLAIPASFFLAALLAFRRLQERSELAVIQATGLSPRVLLRPVLAIAALLTVLLLVIAGHIDPYSRYDYRAAAYRLSASGQLLNLQPGVFTPIGADIVVRAADVADR